MTVPFGSSQLTARSGTTSTSRYLKKTLYCFQKFCLYFRSQLKQYIFWSKLELTEPRSGDPLRLRCLYQHNRSIRVSRLSLLNFYTGTFVMVLITVSTLNMDQCRCNATSNNSLSVGMTVAKTAIQSLSVLLNRPTSYGSSCTARCQKDFVIFLAMHGYGSKMRKMSYKPTNHNQVYW